MRTEQLLGDWLNLSDDSLVFLKDVEEFVVVHLEFVLLKQDDTSRFWNVNSVTIHHLSFSDELHDFMIEVNVELLVVIRSDDKSGLETSLCSLNIIAPVLVVPHLVDSKMFTKRVISTVMLLHFRLIDLVGREAVNWTGDLLEQMASPDDLSGFRWHVSDKRWVLSLVIEDLEDIFELSSIAVKNSIVLAGQIVSKSLSLQDSFKLL
mmetsp:Transcript_33080/g.38445  ORF Transcript_33080/g.38445 Transcript_33080/m.38445 type:complete len:207 (+) Transcript_33080:705-1325(+)